MASVSRALGSNPRSRTCSRSGFSVLEIVVAAALLAVVAVKFGAALDATSKSVNRGNSEVDLDDQALRVLDRIVYAVMGSRRESLFPGEAAPLHDSELNYELHLGVVDGEVVIANPERIGLEIVDGNRMVWWNNPGEEDELRVVWSSLARPFLEGEIMNGVDDNGNGLVDEKGLVFMVDGDLVHILLSLERTTSDGQRVVRTVETKARCRN